MWVPKSRGPGCSGSPRVASERSSILVVLVDTKFACCRPPNFVQLSVGHTTQIVFAIVPGLTPAQLQEFLPELPFQCWNSPSACRFDMEIGCFLFSAFIIACFSPECTRSTSATTSNSACGERSVSAQDRQQTAQLQHGSKESKTSGGFTRSLSPENLQSMNRWVFTTPRASLLLETGQSPTS